MSGFSNYEADQSALYSGGHHSDRNSAESKAKVKNIIRVTAILSVVTILEVGLGLLLYKSAFISKGLANTIFVALTLFKAQQIVSIFMHLGDEKKSMRMTILIPLALFVWFIIAFLADGKFWLEINQALR